MQENQSPNLNETELNPDPIAQLESWINAAKSAGQIEPTAMNLATIGPDGKPRARMVLFKGFHEHGICFYTDYEGAKGQELSANGDVALTFWWDRLERQVRVEGSARKLSREMSEQYFHSRPRKSQLGAMTSHQSRVVDSRETLEARYARNEAAMEGKEIPLPERWGGFVVAPCVFEFWQGRRSRLHDRLRYKQQGGTWVIDRLEP